MNSAASGKCIQRGGQKRKPSRYVEAQTKQPTRNPQYPHHLLPGNAIHAILKKKKIQQSGTKSVVDISCAHTCNHGAKTKWASI
jgi:hypothetical protein